jgi:hypothetical protein
MISLFSSIRHSRPLNPHRPNLWEVTGTTLPLMSTVLAGFCVTIIVQLLTQSEARQTGDLLHVGLTFLAVSIPLFLASTAFAVWEQSYNYLSLTSDVKELMNFDYASNQQEWKKYFDSSHTIWQKWHTSTLILYYLGSITFATGVDLLLWKYIGQFSAISFITIILLTTIFGFILESRSKKVRRQP